MLISTGIADCQRDLQAIMNYHATTNIINITNRTISQFQQVFLQGKLPHLSVPLDFG